MPFLLPKTEFDGNGMCIIEQTELSVHHGNACFFLGGHSFHLGKPAKCINTHTAPTNRLAAFAIFEASTLQEVFSPVQKKLCVCVFFVKYHKNDPPPRRRHPLRPRLPPPQPRPRRSWPPTLPLRRPPPRTG